METLLPLLLKIIAGAVGGIFTGGLFKKISLGFMGNSLAGLVGGALSGHIILAVTGIDLNNILLEVAAAGFSGAALTFALGVLRTYIVKPVG